MKKFAVALGFMISLFAVPAWAQTFNACGQSFGYSGPSQLIVNMTVNLVCPNNTNGVILNNYVKLNMNGHTLQSGNTSAVTSGAGIRINGNTTTVNGPGTVKGFYNNINVIGGQSVVIGGITAITARHTSVVTGAASGVLMSGNTIRLSQISSGIVCNGPCTVSSNTINGHAADGMRCVNTSCGSYVNAFASTGSQDIEVNNSNMTIEYRSCPHDIRAILGSTVNLSELSTCSIDCLNDGTSTYTGTTGVCN